MKDLNEPADKNMPDVKADAETKDAASYDEILRKMEQLGYIDCGLDI